MVALMFLVISILKFQTYWSVSCSDEILYYSESLNSNNLIPAFSSITCPSTYLYLTDGDFSLSTASTINLNEVASSLLEILPLYCEPGQISNCYSLGTRPTILLTDSIVTFIVTGTVLIKNIIFSHKFDFKAGCSICDYCRATTNIEGFYYNDRNELIVENEFLSQDVCDEYTNLDFISVQSTGFLSLQVIIK